MRIFTPECKNFGKKTLNANTFQKEQFIAKNIYFLTEEPLNSYRLLFVDIKELNVIKKFFSYHKLSNFIHTWRGEEIGKKSSFISPKKTKYQILNGGNIKRYKLEKGNAQYIEIKKIKKSITDYTKEKIVIRQLGKHIFSCLDTEGFITIQSVYNLYSKHTDLSNEVLVAILNSRLVDFVYKLVYAEKMQFPRILLENIKNFCIPKISKETQLPFIEKVKEILKLKESGFGSAQPPQADIERSRNVETELDDMVYRLYGLTEEEIGVISNPQGL